MPERKRRQLSNHDDVIKWKHFPHYWPFVRGIHRWPVNSPHKGQWNGALMFSLICAWLNGSINNREAGDLRHYRDHYDVTVMWDEMRWDEIRVDEIRWDGVIWDEIVDTTKYSNLSSLSKLSKRVSPHPTCGDTCQMWTCNDPNDPRDIDRCMEKAELLQSPLLISKQRSDSDSVFPKL